MPFLRNTLGRAGTPEQRARKAMPPLRGSSSAAGVHVSPEKSLQIGAVYSCVRLLAETGSMLPVGVYRATDGGRAQVTDHPLVPLITDQPNPTLDSAEFFRLLLSWQLLRGNAYAYVQRNRAGDPVALWPIAPTSVEPRRREGGRLVYAVTLAEDEYAPITERGGLVLDENMLHYRALGLGMEGLSPVGLARQSVGTAWAAANYIGGFFERDASPGGIISVPEELSDPAYERLEQQWRDLHEGFDRSHRLAILEGGGKWEKVSLSPADAAFIDTHKLTRSDIAGIYGVPPHMIGDVEKSTSWGSGIEQQSLGYVLYALTPWLVRLEKVTARLRTRGDRGLYVKFNVDGLLRGDIQSRYTAYAQGRQWGWLSANDVRRAEDEDPIDDGDTYLSPSNMIPAGSVTAPEQRDARTAVPAPRLVRQVRAPVEDYAADTARHREALTEYFAEVREHVLAAYGAPQARTAGEALAEVDDTRWVRQLAELLLDLALPVARQAGEATAHDLGGTFRLEWARAYLETDADYTAEAIAGTTARQVRAALEQHPDDPREALVELFALMLEHRPGELAQARVNGTGNFARHEGARQAGASRKTWLTTGDDDRPSHAAAHGQTVAIDAQFTVGAASGRWPRDYKLGVDEIAGCDCTLVFE